MDRKVIDKLRTIGTLIGKGGPLGPPSAPW